LKGIEDLCTKRDDLQRQIMVEEEEKHKLQNDIRVLSEKLAKTNEGLAKKISARNEFDKTIAETEAAYMKVSSRILLTIILFAPIETHPFGQTFQGVNGIRAVLLNLAMTIYSKSWVAILTKKAKRRVELVQTILQILNALFSIF